jgi:peptidase, S41 family
MSETTEQAQPKRPKRSNIPVIIGVLLLGIFIGTRSGDIAAWLSGQDGALNTKGVDAIYRELQNKYDGTIDKAKLEDGMKKGLVAGLGDEYTEYMTAEEAQEFDDQLNGSIGGGIGAEIGRRNNQPTIVRVLDNLPAKRAGLLAGDTIIAVNNDSTVGMQVDEVVKKIRGEAGTTVEIKVVRGENHEEKVFQVTREEITSPSVSSKVENGIGIMTISRFDGKTGGLARKAAHDFAEQGVQKVVVDLRGNGGGEVQAAQQVLGIWLGAGQTVITERKGDKVVDTIKSEGSALLGDKKTVVLMDDRSASASEIVAGALKDYDKAMLVGTKTFGKGSVQQLFPLEGGAQLKVTIAKWYTPKGKNINKEGIKPDKEVQLTADDANAGRDPQLDAAKAQ